MGDWRIDLKRARILLSNDDGFDAPGLAVLRGIAESICDDVWVVAPESEQSGAGHSLTLGRPLRIRERGPKAYSIDGTPTDCVLLSINRILAEHKPDLLLSGVNRGTNLGEDITYSGTISAALEATILGVPAIAFSQDLARDDSEDWRVAEAHLNGVTQRLVQNGWPANTLINVNFPAGPAAGVTGIRATRQGREKVGDHIAEAFDPRGRAYYWIGKKHLGEDGAADTDVAAVAAGAISMPPINLDFTDRETLGDLARVLT
ncbi:MAG: 5'/3'-nucleotidase SurE [Alphaproteobacteria bacterium]|nr:5'/3'-nucleotidase SurE [Alphaproteobacteria bacterium]